MINTDSYGILLRSQEWKTFKDALVKKRGSRCEKCHMRCHKNSMQVHHKVYRYGMRPWEYEESDLLCLCPDCHLRLHRDLWERGAKIEMLDDGGKPMEVPDDKKCFRCAGTGFLPEYDYLLGGICFRCFGTGVRDSHCFTPQEAHRYSFPFFNDWERVHRNEDGDIVGKFSGPEDVEEWLLEKYGE